MVLEFFLKVSEVATGNRELVVPEQFAAFVRGLEGYMELSVASKTNIFGHLVIGFSVGKTFGTEWLTPISSNFWGKGISGVPVTRISGVKI